jgi:hypothetical protein
MIMLPKSSYTTSIFAFLFGMIVLFALNSALSYIKTSSSDSIVRDAITSYTIPTPQMRLTYYMGDWFNRTLIPSDVNCDGIDAVDQIVGDRPVLWRIRKMKQIIDKDCKGSGFNRLCLDWLADAYLAHALAVMNSTGGRADMNDQWLLLNIGDSHSQSTELPVVAKTRFSRFAMAKSTGESFFRPIIFPMEMKRHFYLPLAEYTNLLNEDKIFLYNDNENVCKWEGKKSALIWRGSFTGANGPRTLLTTYIDGGPRMNVVKKYFDHNTSVIDVAFSDHGLNGQYIRTSFSSMADQLRFKYILSLEGNDVATGLKWMLLSNSVVFMAKPQIVSFLMEDFLVPFVHYIPLEDDYSNILEMVQWAQENDERCKWISDQATLYMEQLWTSQTAKRENAFIVQNLSMAYGNQFGKALESCARRIENKSAKS